MKSGILYPQGRRRKGEVSISNIVARLKQLARRLRLLGGGLVLISLVGFIWIFFPLAQVELNYWLNPPPPERKPGKLAGLVEDWPNWDVPDTGYSIFIPKIDARSKIVKDVDAGDEAAYLEALKQGVAAAQGLSYPGQLGTTYLFAHSTNSPINFARYNAVFYLLDRVDVGDSVEVVFEDKLYRYETVERKIMDPEDVSLLVPQSDDEKLVLQTCYPPGTTWKRLVIVARRSS
jgi:LPXTG-site transpeptidase (sortase) family protein